MHLVQPTITNNDRLIAGGITILILLGMLTALHLANLPEVKQKTANYQEINWTRFTPKPKTIIAAPKPTPIKVEQPVKFEPPLQAPPQPAPAPAQKIDLSALKAQFESVASPTRKLNATSHAAEPAKQRNAQTKISIKKSSMLAGLNTMLGESSPRLKMTGRGNKGRGGNSLPSLKVGKSNSLGIGKGPDYGSGGQALGAPQGKVSKAASIEIDMLDLQQIGGDFDDLSPIYRALVEWMKRNPAPFPQVVSRFMEQIPADLTSFVNFQIGSRQFEMYLMCKEKLFEVRVCLLEDNNSTYLIDRGFKKNSNFLRTGSVNRTLTKNILSFGTTRKAVSNNRTTEFYQVFLSWWGSVEAH